MEWVALIIWLIIVMLALPLGGSAALGLPSLAVQAVAAIGGLAMLVVFVAAGEPSLPAWIAVGLAVVGSVAMTLGAMGLVSDRDRPIAATSAVAQVVEEGSALLAGVLLPLFIVAIPLTLLVALEIGT